MWSSYFQVTQHSVRVQWVRVRVTKNDSNPTRVLLHHCHMIRWSTQIFVDSCPQTPDGRTDGRTDGRLRDFIFCPMHMHSIGQTMTLYRPTSSTDNGWHSTRLPTVSLSVQTARLYGDTARCSTLLNVILDFHCQCWRRVELSLTKQDNVHTNTESVQWISTVA